MARLSLPIGVDGCLVAGAAGVCSRVGVAIRIVFVFLILFDLHALTVNLEHLLVLRLVLVESIDEELDVGHLINAETLSDSVDLDLEGFFAANFLRPLVRLIID